VTVVGAMSAPLGGDRIAVEAEVREGARLHVDSAAATIALPGRDGERAHYDVRLGVGEGAELRWLPEQLISAAGSDLVMRTRIELAAGARLVFREEQVLGRHGEAPGTLATRLTVYRAGRPLLDQGVTAYDVYQEGTRIHSVGGATLSARLTGLRPGTVYTFTVRARDAADNASPDSDAVDITTASAPGAPPGTAPTRLRTSVGRAPSGNGADITLRWVPPRTGGAIGAYQLFLNGAPTTTIVPGVPSPEGLTSYTFTVTDPPGTRYSVKLRARLPDGRWGDFSAQPTVVVP
ncbi:urease accessory protein UreD, partial [Streptomyces hundungensis]|uniref:urease accessory protein UreD n=1 Tax=Streptomyces hundungensis TaxID=1077946 RepID=UPI0033E7D8B4